MGEQWKQWVTLFWWWWWWGAPKTLQMITSHEIKRCLFLGRKAMTNIDNVLKSRDITLLTKVCLVKAMVFPVVMYECESWTIKKAKGWRTDAFELWCWRRLLRVPWTARRPNQSILKEISPEYFLEGLMLKLKFQYSGHLMWRTDSLKKTLMLRKTEGRRKRDDRGWDGWMASPTPGVHSDSRPSSPWCHPAISSSVVPFPPTPNPSQHQSLFQKVSSLRQVAKVLELQLQHQSFQWIFKTDFF